MVERIQIHIMCTTEHDSGKSSRLETLVTKFITPNACPQQTTRPIKCHMHSQSEIYPYSTVHVGTAQINSRPCLSPTTPHRIPVHNEQVDSLLKCHTNSQSETYPYTVHHVGTAQINSRPFLSPNPPHRIPVHNKQVDLSNTSIRIRNPKLIHILCT